VRHVEGDELNAGEVLVISGPPGAGKSTVARALAARLAQAVLVRGDDVLACVVSGFIPPWDPASDRQNLSAVAATAATAREFAAGGFPVVVDAVLGPWHLGAFADALGQPFAYVVLRPSKTVTVDRATGRGSSALTEVGPVEFMWDKFANLAEHENHVIDTSGLDESATVDAVLAAKSQRRLGATNA
jgi:predicted kinase